MRVVCETCGCTNWTDDPLYDGICVGCGQSLAPKLTYHQSLRTTEFSHSVSDYSHKSDREKLNVEAIC